MNSINVRETLIFPIDGGTLPTLPIYSTMVDAYFDMEFLSILGRVWVRVCGQPLIPVPIPVNGMFASSPPRKIAELSWSQVVGLPKVERDHCEEVLLMFRLEKVPFHERHRIRARMAIHSINEFIKAS